MKNSLRNSSTLPLGTSLGLALLCAPALAGDKVLPGPSVSVWRASVGLESRGDHLHGGGADYKARFDAQGFAYVPALGRAAPQEMPLSFELVSAGREGGPALELALGVVPQAVGNSAIYARGSGLTERYDLRGDGVEQSFVLADRPAGAGDLVVRGRIETPLALSAVSAEGLSFGSAELGGVRIGAVEGIDAAGARAAGSLGMTGDLLELRLPAAFVDAAAYPLVLDPLFGTSFGVSTTANDDLDPDVASEASLNMFLFVWQREFSAASAEIRAQRVDTNSVPQGSTLFLSSGGVNLKPSVGDNTTSNVFLVAWQSGSSIFGPFDILCRQVDGATGVLSTTTLTVASETYTETDACVGGDQIKLLVADQQEQLVIWCRDDFGVSGAQVRAPIGGEPSVLSTLTVLFNPLRLIRRPAISKIGGGNGLYLIVWEEENPFDEDIDIRGRLVDRDGVLIGGEVDIANGAADETDPAVAGMPAQAVFVVAYEVLEPDGVGHDVYARSMRVNGGVLQALAGPIAVEAEDDDEEFDPAVCCPGGKAWVAYCDQGSDLTSTLRVEAFDPFDLVKCEDVVFAQPTGIAQEPAMTLLYGGSFGGPLTMLTWGSLDPDPPFIGDVHAQLLLSHAGTGTVTNLGGACGGGGTLTGANTPDIGTGMFQLNCTGIDPLAVLAILNISAPSVPLSCGACAWVPFSMTINQGIAGTGTAAYVPVIPCDPLLIGAQVDAQFTSVFTASTPCPLFANISVSNIVRLTIGQ